MKKQLFDFNIILLISFFLVPVSLIAQVQNFGQLQMHPGSKLAVFGLMVTNDAPFINNKGMFCLEGGEQQIINGTYSMTVDSLEINNLSDVQLDNELRVTDLVNFVTGRILTDRTDSATEFINFLQNATYTGANDQRHVDGVVRKTGNNPFIFPVGNVFNLQPLSISAPVLSTDHFTVYYIQQDAGTIYNAASIAPGCLQHIGRCEYWVAERTGGTSNVAVTLNWDNRSCKIDTLPELLVARWNGTQWISEGNGFVTGNLSTGSITSGTGCGSIGTVANVSGFGPFTLASSTYRNPLPVELLGFTANAEAGKIVRLKWQTASEKNNDYFVVERSVNAVEWEFVLQRKAAGNSTVLLEYADVDEKPYAGKTFYRLKQVDYDGKSSYSNIAIVNIPEMEDFEVFPVPVGDRLTIHHAQKGAFTITLKDMLGRLLNCPVTTREHEIIVSTALLPAGNYVLEIQSDEQRHIKKLVK